MKATVIVGLLSAALLSTAALAGNVAVEEARINKDRLTLTGDAPSEGQKTEVPGLMSYQGTLTDDSGVAVNDTLLITFSIYGASSGGTAIWTETQDVIVTDGLFNALLGWSNSIPNTVFNDPERWLGTQVGGDPELIPRQRIAAVGYAFWASEADTAGYARSSAGDDGDWVLTGDDMYSGVIGNVGIGTASPVAKLDVEGEINANSLYQIAGTAVLSVPDTQNTFLGVGAGANNTGDGGTFVGYHAGYNNQHEGNTFMGRLAGYANTAGGFNTIVGWEAGYSNTTGMSNTFLGAQAGAWNTIGIRNTFVGNGAGGFNTEGWDNTFVGDGAGLQNALGAFNTFVGMSAGYNNTDGDCNTFLGRSAGHSSIGDGNVFLGHEAGYHETGSNKLYVANDRDSSAVLIYGDFSTGQVGLGTLSPTQRLDVAGTAQVEGFKMPTGAVDTYVLTSDASGVGSWQPAVADSDWAISGDNMYSAVPGSVGIGTASPVAKLDVVGEINVDSVYMIGGDVVLASSAGTWNTSVGIWAGLSDTGSYGTYVGHRAGKLNQGDFNTFVGCAAGEYNTSGNNNTFIGYAAGRNNTEGIWNTFVGYLAGVSNSTGSGNTYLGWEAGQWGSSAESNTFIGRQAGFNTIGNFNTFLGSTAGYSNTTGSENVFLGRDAGFSNTTGTGNVFIGYKAGYLMDSSNKLVIANSQFDYDVLIYGDFSTDRVGIGTVSPSTALEVDGTVTATAFAGDGSGLTGVIGDDLGDHTAMQNIVLGSHWMSGDGGNEGIAVDNSGAVGIGISSPVAKLDIAGDINVDSLYMIKGQVVLSEPSISNLFVGSNAGTNNTGSNGTFVGQDVGYNNQGIRNTFVGSSAGGLNTTGQFNTFVGQAAGYYNDTGYDNTYIGTWAGYYSTSANYNVFVGRNAGLNNNTGGANTFIGMEAGSEADDGDLNTSVGSYAGKSNSSGNFNTNLGAYAGYSNTMGSNNIFIGHKAGFDETGSGKLYIANDADTSQVLIYGDFSSGKVGLGTLSPSERLHVGGDAEVDSNMYIAGNVGIGTGSPSEKLHVRGSAPVVLIDDQGGGNTHLQFDLSAFEDWEIRTGANGFFIKNIDDDTDYMVIKADGKMGIGTTSPARQLFVNGDAGGTTDWYNDSDGRLKKNIAPIERALEKVSRLQGVYFEWIDNEHHPKGQRVGLIAQEVAEVVPEVVEKKGEHYSLATASLVPVLIEAVKELKTENQALKERIEALETVGR